MSRQPEGDKEICFLIVGQHFLFCSPFNGCGADWTPDVTHNLG